jgi:hypothetical protein
MRRRLLRTRPGRGDGAGTLFPRYERVGTGDL